MSYCINRTVSISSDLLPFDCGFHSLRHAFVTQLERVGVSLSERQRLAGHATAAMTEHYTHEDGSAALALPDLTRMPRKGKTAATSILAGILAQIDQISDKVLLREIKKHVVLQLSKV